MTISDTMIQNGYIHKSTRATKKLTQIMSKEWKFDFNEELLFDNIDIQWIDYTFQFDNSVSNQNMQSTVHFLGQPNGLTVMVQTNQETNATVYITVDQSLNFQY